MILVVRGNRDDVVEGGGIEGTCRPVVAGCRNDDEPGVPGVLDGLIE
jgi:hypothetical protein